MTVNPAAATAAAAAAAATAAAAHLRLLAAHAHVALVDAQRPRPAVQGEASRVEKQPGLDQTGPQGSSDLALRRLQHLRCAITVRPAQRKGRGYLPVQGSPSPSTAWSPHQPSLRSLPQQPPRFGLSWPHRDGCGYWGRPPQQPSLSILPALLHTAWPPRQPPSAAFLPQTDGDGFSSPGWARALGRWPAQQPSLLSIPDLVSTGLTGAGGGT